MQHIQEGRKTRSAQSQRQYCQALCSRGQKKCTSYTSGRTASTFKRGCLKESQGSNTTLLPLKTGQFQFSAAPFCYLFALCIFLFFPHYVLSPIRPYMLPWFSFWFCLHLTISHLCTHMFCFVSNPSFVYTHFVSLNLSRSFLHFHFFFLLLSFPLCSHSRQGGGKTYYTVVIFRFLASKVRMQHVNRGAK